MLNQILYTACVTPFIEGGKIDYDSLERILRAQEIAGNGVLLLGSTGEGMSLSDSERRAIVEFACRLSLNTQIIVGVSSYNFDIALEWIDFCNQLPITGYLMTTPIYAKPGIIGQTKWFESLLNHAKYPAMLYNIPGRAGVKLYPEVVKNLEHHHNLLAIKDSGGTLDGLLEYKIAAQRIGVYCGDDGLMAAMAAEGAIGLISVISNAWPELTRKYVRYCLDRVKFDTEVWWQVSNILFSKASNPISIKSLLRQIGSLPSDIVRSPLSREDITDNDLLICDKMIKNWGDNHDK